LARYVSLIVAMFVMYKMYTSNDDVNGYVKQRVHLTPSIERDAGTENYRSPVFNLKPASDTSASTEVKNETTEEKLSMQNVGETDQEKSSNVKPVKKQRKRDLGRFTSSE